MTQLGEMTNRIRENVKKSGEAATDWWAEDYASKAVLLYRGLGIPARYVEGYLADGTDAEQGEDRYYRVEVQAKDAHAWVEIYKDGVGWIPVDVTPGFYEEFKGTEQQSLAQHQALRQQQREQAMQQLITQEAEDEDVLKNVLRVLAWIGIGLFGLLVLGILVLVVRRQWILRRKRAGLESEELWVRLEMSVSILQEVFSYMKWEESRLAEPVKDILNVYWYSSNAKERVGEENVQEVQKYMVGVQEELLEQASKFESLRMKYWEVIL
nr:transglutaminase domain-containing protein [Eubacterium sp.]